MYKKFPPALKRIRFALYDGGRFVAHFSTMGIAAKRAVDCKDATLLDRKTGARFWWGDDVAGGWYPMTDRDTPTFRRIQRAVRRDREAKTAEAARRS